MKHIKSLFIIIAIGLITLVSNNAFSCEIDLKVDEKSKKETYKVGDVIVIKVKVTLTHRVCTLTIDKTKFDTKGLKIEGATDWKETSNGVYERKLKVKVTGTKNGKLSLSAVRTCDKTGGYGTLSLESEPQIN